MPDELQLIDAYWRAANYLSVGQIYLLDNPLLREPLRAEHIKPRLLGHWGTTPGLNFIYAHLNRIIREQDLNVIDVTGPGHGGPGLVANTTSRALTPRYTPKSATTRKACGDCSGSSKSATTRKACGDCSGSSRPRRDPESRGTRYTWVDQRGR